MALVGLVVLQAQLVTKELPVTLVIQERMEPEALAAQAV